MIYVNLDICKFITKYTAVTKYKYFIHKYITHVKWIIFIGTRIFLLCSVIRLKVFITEEIDNNVVHK